MTVPLGLPQALRDGFLDATGHARDIVGRRVLAAAYREGIADPDGGRRHGFDRVEPDLPVVTPPGRLLEKLGVDCPPLEAELVDAERNLAVAAARRALIDAGWRAAAAAAGATDLYGLLAGLPPAEQTTAYERLATEGHNLHPCGRTRLGWGVTDVLAHDQESPSTTVAFVAVRADRHIGDNLGELLSDGYPRLPDPPRGYVLQPVHAWQLDRVLRGRDAGLFDAGVLRPVPGFRIAATPTSAIRTVLLAADVHGRRRYLKLSLDIQVTSTRRGVSIAASRNGPAVTRMLHNMPPDPRLLLLPEVAGAALDHGRDAAAILRDGLDTALDPAEVAVPGVALPAVSPVTGRTVLAEIVARYAATRRHTTSAAAAQAFVGEYAGVLLPPLLTLLGAGVGMEAHLQNSIPVFVDGVPTRVVLRDFAGLRLHPGRLGKAAPALWPGSVIAAANLDEVRAKLVYTALQAHLGEIVARLVASHGLDEPAAWRAVRAVVDDACPSPADHDFLTAAQVPHKALLRMRIADAGGDHRDIYRPVTNPLHTP